MLVSVAVRDLVLIDRLDLDLRPGLGVLTGETGAGKSILLDALQFVIGAKSDRGLVRQGAAQTSVTAVFDPPDAHPARRLLADEGLGSERDLILRRTLAADGRSRAFVNDQAVSVALLRQIGGLLIEIHGQHDERGLLAPAGHRAVLDAYGALTDETAAMAQAAAAHDAAEAACEAAAAELAQAAALREALEEGVGEITALSPHPGEEGQLAAERARLMAGEKIAADLAAAAQALAGAGGLEARLNQALRRLERAPEAASLLGSALAALSRAAIEAAEARAELTRAEAMLAFDAGALQRIDDRLADLREAGRKYRVLPDLLAEEAARMRARLAELDTGASRLAALTAAAATARAARLAAAGRLTVARQAAAERLTSAVMRELPPLKLDKARFRVALAPLDGLPGPEGAERIQFEVATNPGAPFGPLQRIASGGELARFVLALKVALADVRAAPTLIFDEVDQGVSGAVADAVGERLARLGQRAQVLVVTHSPQVAARADHHWRISKATARGQALTRVAALDAADRAEEIARMLSGAEVTQEARQAAQRLIAAGGAR